VKLFKVMGLNTAAKRNVERKTGRLMIHLRCFGAKRDWPKGLHGACHPFSQ
jgi:hypothetical protein